MLQHPPSGVGRAPKIPGARWQGHKLLGGRSGRESRRGRAHTAGNGERPGAAGSSGPGPYQASRAFLVSGQAQQGFSGFFASPASPDPLPSQLAAATEDMAGSCRYPQPAGRTGRCRLREFRESSPAPSRPAACWEGKVRSPPPAGSPASSWPAEPLSGEAKVTFSRDTRTSQRGKKGAGSGEENGVVRREQRAAAAVSKSSE